jgi:hypothetical protein
MPRAKRRPLSGHERRKLVSGTLRRFGPGDDVSTVAARIGQPPRRVHEALDDPIARVRALMGRGVLAEDLARETSLPPDFVKYVMRRTHSQSRRNEARRPHQHRERKAPRPSSSGKPQSTDPPADRVRRDLQQVGEATFYRDLSELLDG